MEASDGEGEDEVLPPSKVIKCSLDLHSDLQFTVGYIMLVDLFILVGHLLHFVQISCCTNPRLSSTHFLQSCN